MADVGHKRIPRGKGWSNTGAAIAAADQGGAGFEGTRRTFGNYDPSITTPRIRQRRDAGDVVCLLVRNESGINLLPKRAVRWKVDNVGKAVNGYAIQTDADYPPGVAGIVDEFWPAAGVPDGELFWLVVRGQTFWVTDSTAGGNNIFATTSDNGDYGWLVCGTGAASTGTAGDEGVPNAQLLTGATENLAHNVQNKVARALSANTTNQTARDVLVDVQLLN